MPSTSSLPNQASAPAHVSGGTSASAAALVPVASSGTVPPFEPNLQDSLNGPHRDGRIRNPVPSKLKGKTDGSKGNFGVMQIEVAGRTEAMDRDAEAKRTSESTELAAKRAFEDGYVSLRRSRFVHLPDEPVAKPFVPAQTAPPAPVRVQRRTPLGPEETKSEQARLLTLLRSLHPVLVVDQICKALAFFGGIPGAPPPEAGGFPESAEANGPGSLFVGWIAEIFPKLGGDYSQQTLDPTLQLDNPPPVKRKRGRPKGSKATKARKDKGVKKGPKPSTSGDQAQTSGVADESWADINDSGAEGADEVDANVMLLAQAANPQSQLRDSRLNVGPMTPTQTSGAARTALPETSVVGGVATGGTPTTRKRGRPKGSKNRPKSLSANSTTNLGATPQAETLLAQGFGFTTQASQAPQLDRAAQVPSGSAGPQSFTAVNSSSPVSIKKRTGLASGPPSNQQGQDQGQISPPVTAPDRQRGEGDLEQRNPAPALQVQAPGHQVLRANQAPDTQNLTLSPLLTASQTQAKTSRSPGQKRKSRGDGNTAAPGLPVIESSNYASMPSLNGHATPPLLNNEGPQLPAAAPEPPPKRQRKGKDARPPSGKGNEAAAHVSGRVTASSRGEPRLSESVPDPSSEQASREVIAGNSGTASIPTLSGDHATASMQAARQGQFALQSPTMESLEAQLQAQFGQQVDIEQRSLASDGAADQAQAMTTLLSQPHQRKPGQQPQHQLGDSGGHNRPLSSQPQPAKGQAHSTPLVSHQQARAAQGQYNQYNVSNSQLQHQLQQQHQHRQQKQHSYVSAQSDQTHQHSQQQQPHQLLGGQQHAQNRKLSSASHHSANTSHQQQQQQQQQQQPQCTSNQLPYTGSQHQYLGGQQSLSSQPRYRPHIATATSAGTASYTTHPSPQFGTPMSNNFGAANGTYRSSTSNLANPSYDQRGQAGTTTTFRSASTHGLPQQSPPFGAASAGMQHRSASTGQPAPQSVQDLTNTQGFAGNASSDWGLFDAGHLDTTGQQGTMGLNNPSYGISTASVRASSNPGSAFAATGLSSFDTSGLGSNERYYGVGRR
ncbi:hypothetical protein MYCTH_42822 [Thermothelomyces thermophilus ATCC 42464]|uniref:Uncharacterized protein n=1 Tax=Thermothelomyces thermophilus (strain ATCC 42464 / BCRC 31852 / DSM 1799) TaxID=573729 RepID=G2Q1X1_THET4|nr:uncharacterized protein MYCTH_42822 [Thermothelomyces thermophilus ATCC 42464]AEO54203.1 hypothetical protein MYCTH_42822 [Thermothelomyces thermophilus ATCC 42464]